MKKYNVLLKRKLQKEINGFKELKYFDINIKANTFSEARGKIRDKYHYSVVIIRIEEIK